MLGRGVLSRLHCLTQQETPTLTLYLDIDQNKMSNRNRGYMVQAEALLKDLMTRHGKIGGLEQAAASAMAEVEGITMEGRSAVVVIHPETALKEVHQARVHLPASAHWRRGAFLRPVVEAMDEYECYGVVLTDSKKARIFTVHLGEVEEHDGLFSGADGRSRALGSDQMRSQKRHDRRHEEVVTNHAKRAIDALHDLSLAKPFDRLIVAGPTKAASQLVRLLPRRLRGKLVETISMAVTAPAGEVLAGILEVQMRMERQQEEALVEGLVAELYDGGKAVAGIVPVIDAANDGRVWKLVYGKDLVLHGGECRDCGILADEAAGSCPRCGADLQAVPALVDRVSQKVLEAGGDVEMVDGDGKIRLEEEGPIAALLRY